MWTKLGAEKKNRITSRRSENRKIDNYSSMGSTVQMNDSYESAIWRKKSKRSNFKHTIQFAPFFKWIHPWCFASLSVRPINSSANFEIGPVAQWKFHFGLFAEHLIRNPCYRYAQNTQLTKKKKKNINTNSHTKSERNQIINEYSSRTMCMACTSFTSNSKHDQTHQKFQMLILCVHTAAPAETIPFLCVPGLIVCECLFRLIFICVPNSFHETMAVLCVILSCFCFILCHRFTYFHFYLARHVLLFVLKMRKKRVCLWFDV